MFPNRSRIVSQSILNSSSISPQQNMISYIPLQS
ncbi:hypothetical protein JMJ77_0001401, partial [Colletotrichum scovillei]